MRVLTISGWGQKSDVLTTLAPQADHVDYHSHQDINAVFDALPYDQCDVLIGWSLGGQIALRALDKKRIKTRALCLLATPFQFVMGGGMRTGMAPIQFESIIQTFKDNPSGMLEQFVGQIALNDSRKKEVVKQLRHTDSHPNDWLYWLEELGRFSCNSLTFESMPSTHIFHGRQDAVVDVSQSSLFVPFMPKANIHIYEDCGHGVHIHAQEDLTQLIGSL